MQETRGPGLWRRNQEAGHQLKVLRTTVLELSEGLECTRSARLGQECQAGKRGIRVHEECQAGTQ